MLRVLDFVDGYHPAPDDDGSFMRQVEQIIRRSANGTKLFRYIYQRSTTVKLALVSESNDDKVFLISLCRSSDGMKNSFSLMVYSNHSAALLAFLGLDQDGQSGFFTVSDDGTNGSYDDFPVLYGTTDNNHFFMSCQVNSEQFHVAAQLMISYVHAVLGREH